MALQSFASGCLAAAQNWSGLLDSEDSTISSCLVGIWRHLPDEEIGDFASVSDELLSESPLENLDDAIEDIAVCIKQIAAITRGFSEKRTHKTEKPYRRSKHR